MSGSSFDYLCYKEEERLFESGVLSWMEAMADKLDELGYADLGLITRKLKEKIEGYNQEIQLIKNQSPKVKDFFLDFEHYAPLEDSMFYRLEEEIEEDPDFIPVLDRLRTIREDAQKDKDKLEGVWKAVEWYCSADWGRNSVTEAVEEYRKKYLQGENRLAGGSFEYLSIKESDQLFRPYLAKQMEKMAIALDVLGYINIADETRNIKKIVEEFYSEFIESMEPKAKEYFAYIEEYGFVSKYVFLDLEEKIDDGEKEFSQPLEQLKSICEEVQTAKAKLEAVWKAVEWYHSGDWEIDKIKEEVEKYNKNAQ